MAINFLRVFLSIDRPLVFPSSSKSETVKSLASSPATAPSGPSHPTNLSMSTDLIHIFARTRSLVPGIGLTVCRHLIQRYHKPALDQLPLAAIRPPQLHSYRILRPSG